MLRHYRLAERCAKLKEIEYLNMVPLFEGFCYSSFRFLGLVLFCLEEFCCIIHTQSFAGNMSAILFIVCVFVSPYKCNDAFLIKVQSWFSFPNRKNVLKFLDIHLHQDN